MLNLIWLIPLLPLIGVAINGLWGRRLPRPVVGAVACGVVGVAFLISIGAVMGLAALPAGERYVENEIAMWIPAGPLAGGKTLDISWGFALDPLASVLLLVVTGVGFLIHLYSVGYMADEKDFPRFFVYLNLFLSMMLTLVLGNNLLVMFVGWEGVGLCSYLLIGFFYDRPFDEEKNLTCADAGRKAFITNRIGDFAFIIGMLFLVAEYGTLHFGDLQEAIVAGVAAGGGSWLLVAVGILLFIGAAGKSAQIPLYVWLPDAMAGPTPVSALIHAATMVTAGVYMVCRMSPVYSNAPEAAAIVAFVGALTALLAATMGLCANDIKKVLAYSTVSQLGFMFAAAGVGAYIAAMFHVMTHAFFKACLFLGAGSVIHGLHHEQDIRRMGGVKRFMPVTRWTFLIATLAIAGLPFVTAGFYSKDEILAGAWFAGNKLVWGMLVAGAVLTAFYMMRVYWLTFEGEFRGDEEKRKHAHESPAWMTGPLVVLAALSIVGGFINTPKQIPISHALHDWLDPVFVKPGGAGAHGLEHAAALPESGVLPAALADPAPVLLGAGGAVPHDSATVWMLIAIASVAALAGLFFGWVVYSRGFATADRIAKSSGPLFPLVRNLYWVDELYRAAILEPFYKLSRFFAGVDKWIVDGLVNAAGVLTEVAGQIIKLFQTGYVRNYALMVLLGVIIVLAYFGAA
jgi:NADH-quinone oxidoreductase subunit L